MTVPINAQRNSVEGALRWTRKGNGGRTSNKIHKDDKATVKRPAVTAIASIPALIVTRARGRSIAWSLPELDAASLLRLCQDISCVIGPTENDESDYR
jgi:hypothetical protein